MAGIGRPSNPQTLKYRNVGMKNPQTTEAALKRMGMLEENGVKYVDGKKHNKMGKEEFLKLLTTQLANQDPSNPMDQKQFTSELAQFAQLEQLSNINTAVSKQNDNAPAESKFYGASFLGRRALTSGTTVVYDGESRNVEIPFFLPKNASDVMVRIFDSKGQMIGQIEEKNLNRGQQAIMWNGKQLDNALAAKGSYTFEVRAWDSEYNEFKGETKSQGLVTGVSFENGETVLTIDGQKKLFLRDVERFEIVKDNKGKVLSGNPERFKQIENL